MTSFFTYNVKSGAGEVLKPTIDNIPTAEEKVAPGEMVYLTPPSISMTREEGFGYIGLEEDDDANTSTWYNVEAISATDNDYEITNNNLYFSAGTEGTYKLKYTAYLIKYATSAVKAAVSGEESLQINANGQLIYTDAAGATHLVYLDEEGKLTADDFTGESLPQFVKDNVEGEAIESDSVITITVTSASLEINDSEMNLHYDVKTEFDVGDDSYIEVIKPRVKAIGTADVDDENTTVTITRNSTNLATNIKLNEWADTDDISLKDYFNVDAANGKIYLKFIKDGKYTITYNLKSTVGTTDTYSVTLSAGDTTPPELEIKDEIVKENYKVGDSLHIAFSHATVEDVLHVKDGSQSVESLLESLEVKIKYEDNAYETLTDEAAASDEHFEYNYKLEQKGTYTLSITIQDAAGNPTTKTISFEVGTEEGSSVDAGEVMGGVLIGLSVALLAGVVIYFAVSKKKLDKKEKGYKLDRSKSRRR